MKEKRKPDVSGVQTRRKNDVSGMQAFECEVALLAAEYHDKPAGLSYRCMATVLGDVFAAQCLADYGYKGYEFAKQGTQAILSALDSMRRRSALGD